MEKLEDLINKKQNVLEKINHILNKDLEVLDPKERTVSRWFDLLEGNDDMRETREQLWTLQTQLLDLKRSIIKSIGSKTLKV